MKEFGRFAGETFVVRQHGETIATVTVQEAQGMVRLAADEAAGVTIERAEAVTAKAGVEAAIAPDATFRTGQVARLIGVTPRTAGKLIDIGRIKGFRVSAAGRLDRRVRWSDLKAYADSAGIPVREAAALQLA